MNDLISANRTQFTTTLVNINMLGVLTALLALSHFSCDGDCCYHAHFRDVETWAQRM